MFPNCHIIRIVCFRLVIFWYHNACFKSDMSWLVNVVVVVSYSHVSSFIAFVSGVFIALATGVFQQSMLVNEPVLT
jgi:cytochrome b subunit of formate dehydrogenase